ncbi:hypothetical protein [Leeia aquatica]|uniref:Uncharacterized protein n=1 Tax=Leeia aquatica TaxID=2725557 RepID=A0A847RZA6_9NEIS|nr:hypothetical protein [Leeia aquatica]NLR75021.1 hypothetical protein [Leeia aquatica]
MKNEQYEVNYSFPTGEGDLSRFEEMALKREPFTFVRFSDGEIEVLRNRKLVIADGVTEFRGNRFSNHFPEFDKKSFDPLRGKDIRRDLLSSALFRDLSYFKGIPTYHNGAVLDREFMLRLNGGFTSQMTFSDLFLNSNFIRAREQFFPRMVAAFSDVLVVCNWRCKLENYLSRGRIVQVPDNFFSSYLSTLNSILSELKEAPESALILSSASSLSNILGHQLRLVRPDLTFIDIGTVLNDCIGLPMKTRAYHKLNAPKTMREKFSAWCYRRHPEYKLKW